MNENVDDLLSGWLDDTEENAVGETEARSLDASETIAESLLLHGLLSDIGSRDEEKDADRISAVMERVDSESEPVSTAPCSQQRRRRFAILTSVLTIAAAVMVMFVAFGPHQRVSAAMASLEKVVEAAAKRLDRSYQVGVIEEYPREKRPRNLSVKEWKREAPEHIDGAKIYVRSTNEYVMTVMLKTGVKRTSGCDGQHSWSFRENGPVHLSTDLNRFRGGMPGNQQDIPFLNLHANLSQLSTGYDVTLAEGQEMSAGGTGLSKLICVRKSHGVRGTKWVTIWFDNNDGTIHNMLLDGLPRGRGGPKSVMLELIDQSDLAPDFFSHESHHESGRLVLHENEQQ